MPIKPIAREMLALSLLPKSPKEAEPFLPPGWIEVAYFAKGESVFGRPLERVGLIAALPRMLDYVSAGGSFNYRLKRVAPQTVTAEFLWSFVKRVPAAKEMVESRFPDYKDAEKRMRAENRQEARAWKAQQLQLEHERRSELAKKASATRKANLAKMLNVELPDR